MVTLQSRFTMLKFKILQHSREFAARVEHHASKRLSNEIN